MKPTPTSEEVIAALGRTGFLLEQDVANKLGPRTSTGWAFEDPDTGTSREVDVYNFIGFHSMSTEHGHYRHFAIDGRVVIECKSYQWPWIVLTKDWEESMFPDLPAGTDLTIPMQIKLGVEDAYSVRAYDAQDDESFVQGFLDVRFNNAPRAVQLVKLNKKSGGWEAGSENIYNEITYPLAKAVDYFAKAFEKRESEELGRRRSDMQIVFPALVVTSPIYSVTRNEAGELEVAEVKHAVLERVLQSSTVSGQFMFDIVSYDYIEEWYENTIKNTLRYVATKLPHEIRDLVRSGLSSS